MQLDSERENELLVAVTRTLHETTSAKRAAERVLLDAKNAQKNAQAAYDLVCKLIQGGHS